MKLSHAGIKRKEEWEAKGIQLPPYDPYELSKQTRKAPVWVHFGIGNIFRIFIGGIADTLIRSGKMDRGIICAESFDIDIIDKIYRPYDNLVLSVTLHEDGRIDKRVLGSLAEAIKVYSYDPRKWDRMKEIFTDPGLQMVSFTITEKGYALRTPEGEYFPFVKKDLEEGPDKVSGVMGIVTAMLLERYKAGGAPLALVSMDNVSQNGDKLKSSVYEVAEAWVQKGFADGGFLSYVEDDKRVSFPWTMIDKITPRPSDRVYALLTEDGVEEMHPVITSRSTYIAPYANAEGPQYLVIEDSFPNGRPPFEDAGVYMTDRETVNKSERMKVTACLNPIHTALCSYDALLGYELFADGMKDPELDKLARLVGYKEGLPVAPDPKILSPTKFLDELMAVRFPNPYLGDTTGRICTDMSQMVGIRFGETVKAYMEKDGTAAGLTGIPLAIAGWIRYLLGVTDEGEPIELSPDPMMPYLKEQIAGLKYGHPESLQGQLKLLLSNKNIFGVDYYEAGLGEKIEEMLREELAGPGAVRAVLRKYL